MGSGGQGGVIIKFVFSRCGGGSSNLDGGWGHARWLDKKKGKSILIFYLIQTRRLMFR